MKRILITGAVLIIICSILSACTQISNNKQNNSDTSHSPNSNYDEKYTESQYTKEDIEGKASIENVIIDKGQINLQIKNLTTDNILVSAYLVYIRLEKGKEMGVYSLDCELLNLSSNDISDTIIFNPQKPLGKEGIIKITELVFSNEKDNYKKE
jgi:hypothetical protein